MSGMGTRQRTLMTPGCQHTVMSPQTRKHQHGEWDMVQVQAAPPRGHCHTEKWEIGLGGKPFCILWKL